MRNALLTVTKSIKKATLTLVGAVAFLMFIFIVAIVLLKLIRGDSKTNSL